MLELFFAHKPGKKATEQEEEVNKENIRYEFRFIQIFSPRRRRLMNKTLTLQYITNIKNLYYL